MQAVSEPAQVPPRTSASPGVAVGVGVGGSGVAVGVGTGMVAVGEAPTVWVGVRVAGCVTVGSAGGAGVARVAQPPRARTRTGSAKTHLIPASYPPVRAGCDVSGDGCVRHAPPARRLPAQALRRRPSSAARPH